MRLENGSIYQLEKEILAIAAKYVDLNKYRVFFFGSRVGGKGDERSDIDIGIEGSKPLPDGALSQIQEELDELPILYKIQVVDFGKVSQDFREVALKDIEEIKLDDKIRSNS